MHKAVKDFFRYAEVARTRDGLMVHIDNQLYLIKVVGAKGYNSWGYFEVYKRVGGKWELIVEPLLEIE
jgi:hypothetical protein